MSELLRIGEAAKFLGKPTTTLHFWELTGKLLPVKKSPGGHRFYSREQLHEFKKTMQS